MRNLVTKSELIQFIQFFGVITSGCEIGKEFSIHFQLVEHLQHFEAAEEPKQEVDPGVPSPRKLHPAFGRAAEGRDEQVGDVHRRQEPSGATRVRISGQDRQCRQRIGS